MQSSPFSSDQTDILRSIVDRIIPEDDYPGAWKAGVGSYIERLIADREELVQQYELGLTACNEEAVAAHGHSLLELSESDRDTVLARIESGSVLTEWIFDPAEFFRMVVRHTMEGFYADPGNGGNLDGVAWKMVGFEVTA